MPNFTIEYITLFDELKTNQRVGKLVRDGKCILDSFLREIERDKNLRAEIDEIFAIIEDVANGKMLPKTFYRKLNTVKLKFPLYEAKSKHLRLYLIQDKATGKILLTGGKKQLRRKTYQER